jgi:hypothetical protein
LEKIVNGEMLKRERERETRQGKESKGKRGRMLLNPSFIVMMFPTPCASTVNKHKQTWDKQ